MKKQKMTTQTIVKTYIKGFLGGVGTSVLVFGLLFFWLAGLANILQVVDGGVVIATTMLGIRVGSWIGLPAGIYAGWWFVTEEL